jgi:hypothetical protein
LNTNFDKIDNLKNQNTMTEKKETQCTIPVVMGSATRMPESFSEYNGDELMSNFGREIDKETEQAIKGKELFSRYAGWNFNGLVWWQDNKWLCEVWCYGSWRETFACDTTEEIMEEVSDEYGYE